MKIMTARTVSAITLIIMLSIIPMTVSAGSYPDKSAIISGYTSSSGYSKIFPIESVTFTPIPKPNLNLFKNTPISWDSSFMDQIKQSPSGSSLWDWDDFTPNTGGCGCCS
jgi:hypothetical protein